ncbi:hypothetical protein D3C77_255980 [compost metagenome]
MHRVEEVHADEVFRTLERLGQQVDGDGRGVGSQNGVFLHLAFHFSQYRLLDLRVLDHSFNDDIDVGEVAIGQGRANRVQRFSHFRRGQTAFFNALAEQLGSFVQAQRNGAFVDVLHQDRGALDRRLVGDTAAHDAGAEHGSLLHVVSDFVVGLGFALEFLVVEEQTDQALGNRSLGQFDEAGGFDFQGLVAAEVGRLLNALDRFNRRRIVRACLTCNETFGGFERHHLLDGVELELLKLRLTLGLVIELAADGALDQVQCGGLQQLRGYHGIDSADFQGVFSTVFLAGGNPLDGVVGTDDARQAHGTAKARVDTQLDFRQADLGVAGHHAEVGSQAHFQTTAQGDAVDRGNGRHGQVFEVAENPVGFQVAGDQFGLGQLEVIDKLGDIRADDEHVLATADNHAFDRGVGLDGVYGLTQFVQGKTVELVDGLTLEVELQFDDAAFKSLNRDGFTFVNHQLISTIWKLNCTRRTLVKDPAGRWP